VCSNFRRVSVSLLCVALLVACADVHRAPGAGSGSIVRENGTLKVMLFLTDDLDELQKQWAQPAPPTLKPINTARIGESVFAVLVFTGCAPDGSGLCQLVADYTVTDPQGKPFNDRERPVCLGKPPPQSGLLALGEETPSVTVALGPAGEYTVHVVVHDRVNGAEVDLSTSFVIH
jgi:hypothetical protein